MLIGISGKKRSGKDLFANLLTTAIYEQADPSLTINIENQKFAGPLKRMADIFLGEGFTKMWEASGETVRNAKLGPEWGEMTMREFLQRFGTEAIRNNLHADAWVNACFSNYLEHEHNWIFTDMRFPNEADAIIKRQGIIIRIERPGIDNSDQHPSEVSLDDYSGWDYEISNSEDIPALREEAYQIVTDLLINHK